MSPGRPGRLGRLGRLGRFRGAGRRGLPSLPAGEPGVGPFPLRSPNRSLARWPNRFQSRSLARGSPSGWPGSAGVPGPAVRCPGYANRPGPVNRLARGGTGETAGPAAAGARRRRRAPRHCPRRSRWPRPASWGWLRRVRPRPPGLRCGRSGPPHRRPRWLAPHSALRPARPGARAPLYPAGRRCGMARRRVVARAAGGRRPFRYEVRTGPRAWTALLADLEGPPSRKTLP